MKKLLSLSLLLFSSVGAISCVNQANSTQNSSENLNNKDKEKNTKQDYLLEQVEPLFKFTFSEDQTKKQEYIFDQKNKPISKFDELNYSLYWYSPFYLDMDRKNREFRRLSLNAKKIINQTLTKDWFWFLNNLEKIGFVLNPYGDEYYHDTFGLDTTQYVLLNDADRPYLITNLKTNKAHLIIKDFDIQNENNQFKLLKSFYLIIDQKRFLNGFIYQKDDSVTIQFTGDVYEIFNNEEVLQKSNMEDFINKFQQELLTQYQKNTQSYISYREKLDPNTDTKALAQKFNDQWFLTLFNPDAYSKSAFLAIKELQKENINLMRFTIRKV
ncbi:aromatic motif membrane protein [Mycoplasmopsis sturni]|uniref:aromatic motif membrane protein n=1 Tax=Mycoplasmopsis sturni TaxID=39047 RepID=UPI000A6A3184|nr:aromatic motif membrane protein [Mycoplasmopsis sturni]